jgi:hypothetical protein
MTVSATGLPAQVGADRERVRAGGKLDLVDAFVARPHLEDQLSGLDGVADRRSRSRFRRRFRLHVGEIRRGRGRRHCVRRQGRTLSGGRARSEADIASDALCGICLLNFSIPQEKGPKKASERFKALPDAIVRQMRRRHRRREYVLALLCGPSLLRSKRDQDIRNLRRKIYVALHYAAAGNSRCLH